MLNYQLEIKQVLDYPRCRIYRQFIQSLMEDRSIRTGGSSGLFYYAILCSYAKLMLYELSKRLPARQMQIVILRVYGYSVSEIAESQGLSAKQVRRILRDVYRVLREICNEEV